MELEVNDSLGWALIWFAIASGIVGTTYCVQMNSTPEVRMYIPAEHKQAADKMWQSAYTKASESGRSMYAADEATEAVNEVYGVPYTTALELTEDPAEYVPPTLLEEAPVKKESTEPGFKDF